MMIHYTRIFDKPTGRMSFFRPMPQIATFGAGCFWGVEKSFRKKFPNVLAKVGYCGGHVKEANYKLVCTGQTGHAEVVQIVGDVNYSELVDFFFRMHDPTTLNRQGGDAGTQYRSTIFYHDDTQKKLAEQGMEIAQKHYGGKVVTTIEPYHNYFEAEGYHQEYLFKNPHGYECATHFERTWEKIESLFLK
jgi:peptide-methionine (S)-S-oxide reductase